MTREEAMEYLEIERTDYDMAVYNDSPIREALNMAIEALKEPERVKAKWKLDWDRSIATCSKCNHDYYYTNNGYLQSGEMRFCPFCGAEMENRNDKRRSD